MLKNAIFYFSRSKHLPAFACGVVGVACLVLLIMAIFSERTRYTQSDPIPKTRTAFRTAHAAIVVYRHEYGIYPKSFQDMTRDKNQKHITFLNDLSDLQDAWGQCIRYTTNSRGFELRSSGRDKTFDTLDDIVEKY
ncbi:MAG: hypothetical protein PHI84_02230 [Kiritimatiellae bacterium]|nr:hypothetical protein [Kiritimatiellia bacterium]